MKISVLCSSDQHPVNAYLEKWICKQAGKHQVGLYRKKKDLLAGDLLFLISCNEIVKKEDRDKFSKVLLIHASALPKGRGWSPHVWDVINGNTELTLTLLEAEDEVDSGAVWKKVKFQIDKDELYDEINEKLFNCELQLMDYAVESYFEIKPTYQSDDVEPSYYPKRNPEDSQIDPYKSIYEQFDLIRICDPDRFPAFFEMYGHKYALKLEKMGG